MMTRLLTIEKKGRDTISPPFFFETIRLEMVANTDTINKRIDFHI